MTTARAHGWVAHLRAGGTTPWRTWTGTAEPSGRALPGAQQLELLRRINSASDAAVPATLVDRVLTASAAGRGKADLPLDEVFQRSGPPRLVLITCGGPFDRTTGSYQENIVVTAVPV